MNNMFAGTGAANNNLELDLSTFDFSAVTDYSDILNTIKTTDKVYVKDATDQAWVIANGGTNNLTTSNVLIKT